jgi:exonuclease III
LARHNSICELLNCYGADVICLQETKMAQPSQRTLLSMLGSDFTGSLALPSIGARGGILIAWRQHLGVTGATRTDVHSVSVQFCSEEGHHWWLTCVYGPQSNEAKIQFLQELRQIRAACQGPWMISRDFNLILQVEDKNNLHINRALMGRFKKLVDDLALKEIPLHGRKFAWSNQQNQPTLVKLDRVLCSIDFFSQICRRAAYHYI